MRINYRGYVLKYCEFQCFKESVSNGQFSFVTSIIFLFNRLFFRGLFLEGFSWWSPLKDHPVVSHLLGIILLLIISLALASIIVSNSFVNMDITINHMTVLWNNVTACEQKRAEELDPRPL